MRTIDAGDRRALDDLVNRMSRADAAVVRAARRIVEDVRRRGDAALRSYAARFDGLRRGEPLLLSRRDIGAGARQVPIDLRRAIRLAARNLERVASHDVLPSRRVSVMPGVSVTLRRAPLARVGCYVPGGRYPLVSSLLMTALTARVAGVEDIVVACPRPVPAVLYAARVAGVGQVLRAGGAHAVAALAYGTRTVAAVDKIVGPGNAYVAAAKALVAADCAIDFNAGPTELVVISSEREPRQIAMDLVAQAEHDPAARAILLTTSRPLARAVEREVAALAPLFGAARESIGRHGAIVITRTIRDAVALANRIAPEHLACDDERVARGVRNAGTIFVGSWSVPAAGDYATGSNHVLPTAGAARARGGLTAADFIKTTTVQRVTRAGLRRLAPAAVTLARAESLEGHARSIEERL
jgi:histidinol dehydrogenase